MGINLKKILSVGLAAALATTMCVSFADGDGDDDKGNKNRHRVVKPFEPSVDREETIVISLATNPIEPEGDAEAACVALQIGTNLLMDELEVEGGIEEVIPADSVTLFLTLDGVELVYEGNDFTTELCLTPKGDAPLSNVLGKFVSEGGKVLICPLCWQERLYDDTDPTQGEVADPVSLHNLFLYADKVLTF